MNEIDLIDKKEVAKMIGVAPNTINQWILRKKCPFPFYKISERILRFNREEVLKFLDATKK